jgi:BirA family transcriptional regulator, biotin operon repressor / biotin---[acetyl-CoA-carboxylase] ligase
MALPSLARSSLVASGGVEREPFDPGEFESTAEAVPWVKRVVCAAELDSTNAEALRLAAAGEPHGLVVVADAQTSGRGRLGRSWLAEPGTSLLASWLIRPTLEPELLPLLSLAAGIAAARAASSAGGVEVRLKWPNDLLLQGRKLGGILAESDGRGAVVFGLGLNVRQDTFSEEIRETATSLAAAGGRTPARAWLLAATLSGFGARMDAPQNALDDYRALCDTLGSTVRVDRNDAPPLEGEAVDLTDLGALVLETPSGREIVAAGDVVHLRTRD